MDNEQSVDNLLKSTLLKLGVPVERLRFAGKVDTYITFQIINGNETAYADDDGEAYEHFYRADIYSKKNYLALLKQTKQILKAAGFYNISVNAEVYENDTGLYHVSLDFNYMEE